MFTSSLHKFFSRCCNVLSFTCAKQWLAYLVVYITACKDILPDCAVYIKSSSQCHGAKEFFTKYCPSTCGYCGKYHSRGIFNSVIWFLFQKFTFPRRSHTGQVCLNHLCTSNSVLDDFFRDMQNSPGLGKCYLRGQRLKQITLGCKQNETKTLAV